MKCPQCANEMVKAQATAFGEPYDYCRACKKELKEMQSSGWSECKPTGVYGTPGEGIVKYTRSYRMSSSTTKRLGETFRTQLSREKCRMEAWGPTHYWQMSNTQCGCGTYVCTPSGPVETAVAYTAQHPAVAWSGKFHRALPCGTKNAIGDEEHHVGKNPPIGATCDCGMFVNTPTGYVKTGKLAPPVPQTTAAAVKPGQFTVDPRKFKPTFADAARRVCRICVDQLINCGVHYGPAAMVAHSPNTPCTPGHHYFGAATQCACGNYYSDGAPRNYRDYWQPSPTVLAGLKPVTHSPTITLPPGMTFNPGALTPADPHDNVKDPGPPDETI